MKWVLALLFACGSSRAFGFGPSDPEDNVDKFAHFGLSCALTGALVTIGKGQNPDHLVTARNRFLSSSAVISLGLYKELRDLREGGEGRDSARDYVADLVGIAVGNLIHWEF
jgi:uncharacterized protein YfiM (DUF2279 family)